MINNNLRKIIKDYGVKCTIKSHDMLCCEEINLCGFNDYIIEDEYDIINLYNIEYTDYFDDVQTSVMTTDPNYLAVEFLIENKSEVYIHKQYVDIDKNIIDQYNLIYDEIKKLIPSGYQIDINMFQYKETYCKIVSAYTEDVEEDVETINIEPDMVLISE